MMSETEVLTPRRDGTSALLKGLGVWYGGAAVIVAGRLYAGDRGAPVLWPFLTIIFTFIAFVAILRSRRTDAHILDIGVIFAGMLSLYGAYPILSYALNGFTLSESGESRLFYQNAQTTQLATIGWWYALLLAAFCIAYVVFRRRSPPVAIRHEVDGALIVSLCIAFAVIKIVTAAFGWQYDLSATTYTGLYAVIERLPLFARQLFVQFIGYELTIQIFLLAALFTRYRKNRWWIGAFLLIVVALHALHPGTRTQLFVVTVGAIQMYDYLVRPIRWRWIAVAGVAGFVAFSVLAALRQPAPTDADGGSFLRSAISAPNEFDIVFANAFDLKFTRHETGAFLHKPGLYWAEFVAFIPQQLLPFRKDAASLWYLRTYYPEYYESGGGLAFGLVSEAVTGLGVIELLWRGALLGALFALVHRRFAGGRVGFWQFTFYVWLSVWSFQAIRNTTFCLLTLTLYRFIVPLVAVSLVVRILRRANKRFVRKHRQPRYDIRYVSP